MPELPEVETTRLGIAPYILKKTVKQVIIRNRQLRWPVSTRINKDLPGQQLRKVNRRGKYLLLYTSKGCLLFHLGMSGSLRILKKSTSPDNHDHIDVLFYHGICLRFTDPRRFGSLHWTTKDPLQHTLLKNLGPEPLSTEFSSTYLFEQSRNHKQAIKTLIMNSRIVVGIGNIYANEILFAARIHPKRKAGTLSKKTCEHLVKEIKSVLRQAIKQGGTTLRNFVSTNGLPSYFRMELKVYDHAGNPCPVCQKLITQDRIGQRSCFYCTHCQR